MDQNIENIITMIGCNRRQFLDIIKNKENISMSSGSYYSDYWIFSNHELLCIYDSKGNLK